MQKRYTSTVRVFSDACFAALKPGQWVSMQGGARGQYLGTTARGVIVVRYQPDTFGKRRDCTNNRALRTYAKDYGSR